MSLAAAPAAAGPVAAKAANGPRPRIVRRPVHGVLLLDKPLGLSSNQALQRARRLLSAEKAGHTGTLDPLATGLLPLCFGAATKFSQANLDADKAYRATLCLGRRTTTGDAEGEVVEERPVQADDDAVRAALARFTGPIEQVPPMHSALKHQGRALYDYAREGVEIERAPRRVTIHAIAWVAREGEHGERLVIDVRCSKGTYIRTLAEDIGQALGCGAHLAALRRTASGALSVDDALSLDALEALGEGERAKRLLPPDRLVAHWPCVALPAADAGPFLSGQRRRLDQPDAPHVRVFGPDAHAFLGSAHITAGELIADRLLSPTEVQALCGGAGAAG